MCRCLCRQEDSVGSRGAGVTGSSQPRDVGAGNKSSVFCKSRKLNYWAITSPQPPIHRPCSIITKEIIKPSIGEKSKYGGSKQSSDLYLMQITDCFLWKCMPSESTHCQKCSSPSPFTAIKTSIQHQSLLVLTLFPIAELVPSPSLKTYSHQNHSATFVWFCSFNSNSLTWWRHSLKSKPHYKTSFSVRGKTSNKLSLTSDHKNLKF